MVLIRSNASTTLPAQPVVGPAIPYVAGFGVGAVLLSLAAAGYSDSDDHFYIEAADGWLAHMPFVGTTHWHLRHPFVLAIAASFAAFGRTELALMLPTLLAYVSILLLTIWMVLLGRGQYGSGFSSYLCRVGAGFCALRPHPVSR